MPVKTTLNLSIFFSIYIILFVASTIYHFQIYFMNFQLCKSDEDNKCYSVGKGCKMLKYYVVNILLKHQLQNENPIQEGQI
jgi:hypothetical protein